MSDSDLGIHHKLMNKIAWAGAIPLLMTVFYAWIRSPAVPIMLFIAFSGVVLAFLAGSFWGQALLNRDEDKDLRPLIFVTVMVTLTVWTALILAFTGAPLWAIVALLVGYVLSYAVESRFIADQQPAWYRRMRLLMSTGVAVLHCLMILRLAG